MITDEKVKKYADGKYIPALENSISMARELLQHRAAKKVSDEALDETERRYCQGVVDNPELRRHCPINYLHEARAQIAEIFGGGK